MKVLKVIQSIKNRYMQLLGYSGLLLRCCYAVAKVLRVVARKLLGYRDSCCGDVIARVLGDGC